MDEVFMQVPAVRNMAKSFTQISQVLNGVANVLQGLIMTLRMTAFVGLVGGAAVAQYLEMIQPHIKQQAEKCAEIGGELDKSVTAYENGDQQGATRFY